MEKIKQNILSQITVDIYVGQHAMAYIETIANMRMEAFKEYPYLYAGKLEYERNYLKNYTTEEKAMIAIARVDGILAGVSTGIPLLSDSEIVANAKQLFFRENIDISDYYYYGEVIVLPKFRGLGLTTKLYAAQNDLIKTWGYQHACILTVVRENNHPLKPANYRSPDEMWEHLGFFRNKLTTTYHWPTIQTDGSVKDIDNVLEFWVKQLG